jgi:hypothetical protein
MIRKWELNCIKEFAATALIFLSAQAAWAGCNELKRQAEPSMAAAASAGERYRATGASQVKYKLLSKDDPPSIKVVSEAISETEKMIAAMDRYLDYMNSMKDGGCYGDDVAAQSGVIVIFKSQRDELIIDQKRFTDFVAKKFKAEGQPQQ